uniref:Zinc finger BED domain-containing protein 1 n=1 Tax=Lygus hesperus TaxID=30085 RepID=A0A0A9Y2Z1_LYGHE
MVQKSWRKAASRKASTGMTLMTDEFALYLKAPAEVNLQKSPIAYWLDMAPASPLLSQVALAYVSSVATNVQRLFSKAFFVLTQERNRLKGDTLSKLLFLQSVPKEYFL